MHDEPSAYHTVLRSERRGGMYPFKTFLAFPSTYNLLAASCGNVGIGRLVIAFELKMIYDESSAVPS